MVLSGFPNVVSHRAGRPGGSVGNLVKSLVHKIDFTVDEGKERLNPSCEKN